MLVKKRRAAGAATVSVLIAAAVVASGVGSGNTAQAAPGPGNCGTLSDFSTHCYAAAAQGTRASSLPVYMSGVGADLEVDCLAVANDADEFANWEMWISTNDTDPNSTADSGYWVEEGYTAGTVYDARGNYAGFQWFWADNRPGGGYNEHFIQWATAYQYKNVTFTYEGGPNWGVYLGGTLVGQSIDNGAYAGGTEIGAEMAVDGNGQTHAHAQNWQYTNGGAWSWVDPTFTGYYNNVPSFVLTWAYAPTGVTVHTPLQPCGTTPQVAQQAPAATGSALSLAAIRSITAGATTSYATTAAPTSTTTVQTTRGSANALYGSEVNGAAAAEPVYLVQELGSFSTSRVSPDGGAVHAINGNAMHFVISATTGQVLDWGITGAVNLAPLGSVTALS
jgi:hypothetical protein